jgi:tetratricopeptide (TPR) repeat protein
MRILVPVTFSAALSCPVFAHAQATVPGYVAPLPPLTLAPPLAPGPDDIAQADSLFDAARALSSAGDVADACPKFAESRRLVPGVGIALYLADCYERIGRYASAQRAFLEAEKLARARDDKRAEVASARAKVLEPKVNHVIVDLPRAPPEGATGMQVELDGAYVPTESWGVALPVDPGDHLVVVGGAGAAPRLFMLRVDASNPSATLSAGGWLPGEDLDLVFTNETSRAYLLRTAIFAIDGHAEYFLRDPAGEAAPSKNLAIRRARVPLGDHTIEIDLRFEANGYGILSYLRGYSFDVKSQHIITVSAGKKVAVTATAFEDGSVTRPLGHRLNVAWHQKAW